VAISTTTSAMVRMDGRRLVEPLRGHQCPACLAELLYLQSTEEAPKRGLFSFKHRTNSRNRRRSPRR
jgi:hypothetical protein